MVTSTSARTSEEADRAKEAFAADAPAIAMTIAETTHLLVIHLEENQKTVVFPILQSPKVDIN